MPGFLGREVAYDIPRFLRLVVGGSHPHCWLLLLFQYTN